MSVHDTTITTVFSNAGISLFPGEKPIKNNNCVVFTEIYEEVQRNLGQKIPSSVKARYQFDVYHTTFSGCSLLAGQVFSLLEHHTSFKSSWISNQIWLKEVDTGLFRCTLEAYIW